MSKPIGLSSKIVPTLATTWTWTSRVPDRKTDAPAEGEVREWQATDYAHWANESRRLSERCYEFKQGEPLGDAYFAAQQPFVRQRLLQAGVRLAGKLNSIFTDPP